MTVSTIGIDLAKNIFQDLAVHRPVDWLAAEPRSV